MVEVRRRQGGRRSASGSTSAPSGTTSGSTGSSTSRRRWPTTRCWSGGSAGTRLARQRHRSERRLGANHRPVSGPQLVLLPGDLGPPGASSATNGAHAAALNGWGLRVWHRRSLAELDLPGPGVVRRPRRAVVGGGEDPERGVVIAAGTVGATPGCRCHAPRLLSPSALSEFVRASVSGNDYLRCC